MSEIRLKSWRGVGGGGDVRDLLDFMGCGIVIQIGSKKLVLMTVY